MQAPLPLKGRFLPALPSARQCRIFGNSGLYSAYDFAAFFDDAVLAVFLFRNVYEMKTVNNLNLRNISAKYAKHTKKHLKIFRVIRQFRRCILLEF